MNGVHSLKAVLLISVCLLVLGLGVHAAVVNLGWVGPGEEPAQLSLGDLGFLDSAPRVILGIQEPGAQPGAAESMAVQTPEGEEAALPAVGEDEVERAEEIEAAPLQLAMGDRGSEVAALQEQLVELAFLSGAVDGVFGPQTRRAVESLQTAAGLPADGVADGAFWAAIEAKLSRTEPEASGAAGLSLGDRGDEVVALQRALADLDFLSSSVDGVFGPITERAVQRFQAEAGLPQSGIADDATLAALYYMEIESAASELEEEAQIGVDYHLQVGDSGEQVRALQEKLSELGFLRGSADGVFGPATVQAVQSFQRAGGLTPDGIVGAKTWELVTRTSPGQLQPMVVEDLHWTDVRRIFRPGNIVVLEDVLTGKTFQVRYLYGSNHADVEPLTTADTQVLRSIYGGAWSWERRAVIVQLGDRLIAGSINGYPHGGQEILDNNFPGHFCLHFRGSQLHLDARQDPRHQAMVKESSQAQPQTLVVR